jgi:hypothetical protein
MATLQDIEQAIRNADAAGDGDAVRKLAAARAAMLAQPKAKAPLAERLTQAKQFQASGKPLPPELAGDQEVLNSLTQGFAQQNTGEDMDTATVQRNAQTGRDMWYGGIEGGKRLWAGVKQLGANVQDAYGLLVHGKPYRYDNVTRDAQGNVTGREQGNLETSKVAPVVAQEMLEAQVREMEDIEKGASKGGRNTMATATQLGALTIAPEVALPRATTFAGAAVKNSATGTMGEGLMFDADPGGSDMATAATLPALMGAPLAVVPAIKNYVGRALQRVIGAGRTGARVSNAREALPNVDYSLSQITGVPELKTLERAAYDSEMVNFFAKQTDDFVADTVDALRQPMRDGQTLSNDFVAARETAAKNMRDFKAAANENYNTGIQAARARAADDNPTARIPVQRFTQEADAVMAEIEGLVRRGHTAPMSRRAMDYMRNVLHKPDRGMDGVVNINELADIMVDLTAMQSSKNKVTRALGTRMRKALDGEGGDLDMLEQDATFAADDATKELLETRKEYKRAQTLIRELGDSAAFKLMGVKDFDTTPDELVTKLKGFTPEKRASVRSYMEENSPDLLVSIKDAAVRDMANRARTIREAADSQQDLSQLMDGMFDPNSGFDMRTSGLWNADEMRRIEGIKDGLRVVANNRPVLGGAGTPIKPEDVAINMVSRHSAFVARQVTRILMSAKASQFFTDPVIAERLAKINRSTTGSPINMAARASLLDYLNTNYGEEEEQ